MVLSSCKKCGAEYPLRKSYRDDANKRVCIYMQCNNCRHKTKDHETYEEACKDWQEINSKSTSGPKIPDCDCGAEALLYPVIGNEENLFIHCTQCTKGTEVFSTFELVIAQWEKMNVQPPPYIKGPKAFEPESYWVADLGEGTMSCAVRLVNQLRDYTNRRLTALERNTERRLTELEDKVKSAVNQIQLEELKSFSKEPFSEEDGSDS